ncbi:MAG: hypothetical protein SNJ70_08345 [Armatimonadota bacterium]
MSIDFSKDRWIKIKEDSQKWWAGELDRPLIQFRVPKNPDRAPSRLPFHSFTAFYGLDTPCDEIIDAYDYELSSFEYIGDAFPTFFPNFGAGVMAALLGCELLSTPETNTVWFYPKNDIDIDDLLFKFDKSNIWLNRIKDILKAAVDRWGDNIVYATTDIGGSLDILASFRPGEKLIIDLYDNPEKVKELNWQIHDLWFEYFKEFESVTKDVNQGYSAWCPIYSSTPYYMLQCDFCYMISPEMFDEFVKPELTASCKRLSNPFYHLDGPGQLPHLDSLLSIPELKGIQWIPGSGVPDWHHWPEVYRKIRDAGKLIQVYGNRKTLDVLTEQLGSPKGIVIIGSPKTVEEAQACYDDYCS